MRKFLIAAIMCASLIPLAACGGGSLTFKRSTQADPAALVKACAEADKELAQYRKTMERASQEKNATAYSVQASLIGAGTLLSTNFATIESQISDGDVKKEMNSVISHSQALVKAITVMDGTSLDNSTKEVSALQKLTGKGGSLDLACRAAGAKPFTSHAFQ